MALPRWNNVPACRDRDEVIAGGTFLARAEANSVRLCHQFRRQRSAGAPQDLPQYFFRARVVAFIESRLRAG